MMNNINRPQPKFSPKKILWIGAGVYAVILILVHWTYFYEPFSQFLSPFWNGYLPYFIILIPAIGAAIAGTLVLRQFDKDEPPYRIWQAFSIGLWLWVAGEFSGLIYGAVYWETVVPDFTLTDIFWLLGYFFLGLSLYYQLRLVYGAKNKRGTRIYLGLFAIALLITAGLTNLAGKAGLGDQTSWVVLFIAVLYPVFDLTEGAIAIWLSFLFGRGQWSRPWWGLILFALADSIDSFYWMGGYDFIPASFQTLLDYTSLAAYPASYMVAGLALLSNYFILRYGENSGLLTLTKKSELNRFEK